MNWSVIEWVLPLYWLSMIMVPTFTFITFFLLVKRGIMEKFRAIRYYAGIAIIPILLYGIFFFVLVSLEQVAQIDLVTEELARSFFLVIGIGLIIWLVSLLIFSVTLAFLRRQGRSFFIFELSLIMTKHKTIAVKLYLLNLALLATHEIDSAFWHEWNLFNLPGGIDLFLVINLALLLLFMFGFEKVVKWEKGAPLFSYILAFSGIFAFVIHYYFILNGNPEFTSVVSFAILLLTFITSIVQLVFLILIKKQEA